MKEFLEEIKLWLGLITGLIIASVALLDKTSGLLETHPYVFPIVSGLLAIICFVYVWQANKKQKTIREMGKTEEEVKPKFRKGFRLTSSIICVGILVTSIIKLAHNSSKEYEINPNGDFIIGIADFYNADRPSLDDDKITPRFYSELDKRMREIEDTTVYPKKLKIRITQGRDSPMKAKKLGHNSQSTLVVYGWYQENPDSLWAEVGVEIMKDSLLQVIKEDKFDYQAQVRSFQVQVNIAEDISYLVYLILGISHCVNDNSVIAKKYFDKIPKQKLPSFSKSMRQEISFYKGYLHHILGDSKTALTFYTKSIKINSNNPEAYFNQAILLIEEAKVKLAKEAIEKGLSSSPKNEKLLYLKSLIESLFKERKHKKEIKTIKPRIKDIAKVDALENKLIEFPTIDAHNPKLLNTSFDLLFFRLSILKLPSPTPESHKYFLKAYYLIKSGKFNESVATYLNKAIQKKPLFIEAINNRAYLNAKLKKYKKAIIDLNNIISIDPSIQIAYINKAICEYNLKNYDEALSSINKAINLNSNYSFMYVIRGLCYYSLSKFDKSSKDFYKAINLNSDYQHETHQIRINSNSFVLNRNYSITTLGSNITKVNYNIYDYYGASLFMLKDYQGALNEFRDEHNKVITLLSIYGGDILCKELHAKEANDNYSIKKEYKFLLTYYETFMKLCQ